MTKSKQCPRCGEYPIYTDGFHRGVGARSRIDNKTQICGDCGIDEAMQDFMGFVLVPVNEWPIERTFV